MPADFEAIGGSRALYALSRDERGLFARGLALRGCVRRSTRLYRAPHLGSITTRVLSHPAGRGQDFKYVFAPDGRRIAFLRADAFGLQHIHVVDTVGGAAERAITRVRATARRRSRGVQPTVVAPFVQVPVGKRRLFEQDLVVDPADKALYTGL